MAHSPSGNPLSNLGVSTLIERIDVLLHSLERYDDLRDDEVALLVQSLQIKEWLSIERDAEFAKSISGRDSSRTRKTIIIRFPKYAYQGGHGHGGSDDDDDHFDDDDDDDREGFIHRFMDQIHGPSFVPYSGEAIQSTFHKYFSGPYFRLTSGDQSSAFSHSQTGPLHPALSSRLNRPLPTPPTSIALATGTTSTNAPSKPGSSHLRPKKDNTLRSSVGSTHIHPATVDAPIVVPNYMLTRTRFGKALSPERRKPTFTQPYSPSVMEMEEPHSRRVSGVSVVSWIDDFSHVASGSNVVAPTTSRESRRVLRARSRDLPPPKRRVSDVSVASWIDDFRHVASGSNVVAPTTARESRRVLRARNQDLRLPKLKTVAVKKTPAASVSVFNPCMMVTSTATPSSVPVSRTPKIKPISFDREGDTIIPMTGALFKQIASGLQGFLEGGTARIGRSNARHQTPSPKKVAVPSRLNANAVPSGSGSTGRRIEYSRQSPNALQKSNPPLVNPAVQTPVLLGPPRSAVVEFWSESEDENENKNEVSDYEYEIDKEMEIEDAYHHSARSDDDSEVLRSPASSLSESDSASLPDIEDIVCSICFDVTPTNETFKAPCLHVYCPDCVERLVDSFTRDETLFPFKCCKEPIAPQDVVPFIPDSLRKVFHQKLEEYSVAMPYRLYCYSQICSSFLGSYPPIVVRRNAITTVRCTQCRRSTCPKCKQAAHPGEPDCKEHQAAVDLKKMAKSLGWQKCSSCKWLVERTVGCDHLVCRCGHEFCYVCGKAWSPMHQCAAKYTGRDDRVVGRYIYNEPLW